MTPANKVWLYQQIPTDHVMVPDWETTRNSPSGSTEVFLAIEMQFLNYSPGTRPWLLIFIFNSSKYKKCWYKFSFLIQWPNVNYSWKGNSLSGFNSRSLFHPGRSGTSFTRQHGISKTILSPQFTQIHNSCLRALLTPFSFLQPTTWKFRRASMACVPWSEGTVHARELDRSLYTIDADNLHPIHSHYRLRNNPPDLRTGLDSLWWLWVHIKNQGCLFGINEKILQTRTFAGMRRGSILSTKIVL